MIFPQKSSTMPARQFLKLLFFLRCIKRPLIHQYDGYNDPLSSEEQAILMELYPRSQISGQGNWSVPEIADEMLHLALRKRCCNRPYYADKIIRKSLESMKRDRDFDHEGQINGGTG